MLENIAYFDEQLFLFLNNNLRSPFGDIYFGYSTWLGDALVLYPLCVFLAFLFDRPHFKRNIILITIVLILGGLINSALKDHFNRMRPLAKFGGWKESGLWYPGPNEKFTIMFRPFMYGSFPSGHCAAFFGAVAIFSLLYRKLTGLLLLLGLIIMLSRVYVGAHFPLDTVGGAAIGALTAFAVFRSYLVLFPSISKLGGDAGVVKRTRL
ncbi:MAG: phosphatase PAP2 family protein [Candidatus Omnitrophica bacterium]|nr:phosphatase PAP2 family protein [Candidatus Omnitrophota bacterium]